MENTTLRTVHVGGLHKTGDKRTLEEINIAEVHRLIPTVVFLFITCAVGIIGNILVIHVYRTRFKLSNTKCFILCLSVVDLFTCCVAIPLDISTILKQYTFDNVWLCKISRTFSTLGIISSSFILLFIAVDRFRKVCKPFGWQIETTFAKFLCGLAIIIGVLASWPAIFVYGKKTFDIPEYNLTGTECSTADEMQQMKFPFVYALIFGFLFLGGILVMTMLYCLIAQKVRKHSRKMISSKFSIALTSLINGAHSSSHVNEIDPGRSAMYEVSKTKIDKLQKGDNLRKDEQDSNESWADKKDSKLSDTISAEVQEKEHVSEKLENVENLSTVSLQREYDDTSDSEESNSEFILKTETYKDMKISDINASNKEEDADEIPVQGIDLKEYERESNVRLGEKDPPKQKTILRHFTPVSIRLSNMISRTTGVNRSYVKSKAGPIKRSHVLIQVRARRTAFIMFIVTLGFISSFLPHLLLMLIRQTRTYFVADLSDTERAVYKLFLRSFYLNAAINPIIYIYCDSKFKSACKDIFHSLTH